MKKFKVAYIVQFPIHYQVGMLVKFSEQIDLHVFFISDITSRENYVDPGFGPIKWGISLLTGYKNTCMKSWLPSNKFNFFSPLIKDTGILFKENWDAVWIHGYAHYFLLFSIVYFKIKKIPVLYRSESNLIFSPKKPLKDLFVKLLLDLSNALLYISNNNLQYYKAYGADPEKLFSVPYAVDNEFFKEKNRSLSDEIKKKRLFLGRGSDLTDGIIILYASKLMRRKNPHHLLEAFKMLAYECPNKNLSLVFVGTGEMEISLKQQCASDPVLMNSVCFEGFQNQHGLPLYYGASDVFVLPSYNEPFGMVIPEVMNFSKPIIVSDQVGAGMDLVENDENGFVFPAGDINALKNCLKEVVNNDSKRRSFGLKSFEKVQNWSYEVGVQNFLKVLNKLCGELC